MSIIRHARRSLVAAAVFSAGIWGSGAHAHAATVTVTKVAQSGPGSLAEAIAYANKFSNTTIAFAVPPQQAESNGQFRILIPSQMLTRPTVIDGTSQTALSDTNAGGPEIFIRPASLVQTQALLAVSSTVRIKGIEILGGVNVSSAGALTFANSSLLRAPVATSMDGALTIDASSKAEYLAPSKLTGALTVNGAYSAYGLQTTANTKFLGTGTITFTGGDIRGELNIPTSSLPKFDFQSFYLVGTLRVPAKRTLGLAQSGSYPYYNIVGGTFINDGTVQLKMQTPPADDATKVAVNFTTSTASGEILARRGSIQNNGLWQVERGVNISSLRQANDSNLGTFVNNGKLLKPAGGKVTFFCDFTNSGSVLCNGGYLGIFGSGAHTGDFTATATGAQIQLGNTATLRDGTTLNGNIVLDICRLEGQVTVTGRTVLNRDVTALPTARFVGKGAVIFDGELLGELTLGNTAFPKFVWGFGRVAGTLNIPAGVLVQVLSTDGFYNPDNGNFPRGIPGGTLNNKGTLSFDANTTDTLFFINTSGTPQHIRYGQINNEGTLQVNEGVVIAGYPGCAINNSGRLEKRGAASASISTDVNSSGVIESKQGDFVVGTAGTLSGLVKSTNGLVSMFAGYPGRGALRTGTRTEGRVHFGYSRLEGTVNVTGVCELGDPGPANPDPDTRTDTLIGTPQGSFTGPGTVRWMRGAISGTLNLAASPSPRFQWESGTLKGALNVPAGGKLLVAPAVPAQAGADGYTKIDGGVLRNAGKVEVASAARLDVPGGTAGYLQSTGGETQLDGSYAGSLKLAAGTLSGRGSVLGNLGNSGGTVAPGGPGIGILTVTGTYAQTSSSTLRLDIANRTVGTYDMLHVEGAATLGGALDIAPASGFTLSAGDLLRIVDYGSHNGAFASLPSGTTVVYNDDHALLKLAPLVQRALQEAPSAAAAKSNVALSSASAAPDGTVSLVFTGAVASSASDAARYTATQNGAALGITAVQHPQTNIVVLYVDGPAANASLNITYNVLDPQGRTVNGVTTVTVR